MTRHSPAEELSQDGERESVEAKWRRGEGMWIATDREEMVPDSARCRGGGLRGELRLTKGRRVISVEKLAFSTRLRWLYWDVGNKRRFWKLAPYFSSFRNLHEVFYAAAPTSNWAAGEYQKTSRQKWLNVCMGSDKDGGLFNLPPFVRDCSPYRQPVCLSSR